jgi:hypothetical protein
MDLDMSRAAYNRTVASIFDAVLDERLTPAALEAIANYAGVSGASYLLPGGVCDVLGSKLHESSSHIVLVGFHRAVGDVDRFPGNMEAPRALLDPLCNAARLNVGLIDIGYRSAIAYG